MRIKGLLHVPGIEREVDLLRLARTRDYNLYCKAVQDILAGKCTFCDPDQKLNKVILEDPSRNWMAWQSPAPEKHTKHHFIVAPRAHVVSTINLLSSEWVALQWMLEALKDTYGYKAFGLMIRDNAPLLAGTIEHLHVHVMVPDGTGRVESPFCKTPQEEEAGAERAAVFEKLRVLGLKPGDPIPAGLSPEEQDLVAGRV